MEGAPLRQITQRSGLDLIYYLAYPSQLRLPQHQLVLRLDEEKTGQIVLLHSSVQPRPHLRSLLFQTPHTLFEKLSGLLRGKPGQEREPGRELRVLLDRLPQELTQPGKELLTPRAGDLIDRPLRSPPLTHRLPCCDESLPLKCPNHRVQRTVPEPHRLVLAPLPHQRNHLVRVHRPLVQKRHHRQSQRVGYLPLRRHRGSLSRNCLVENDYMGVVSVCQVWLGTTCTTKRQGQPVILSLV